MMINRETATSNLERLIGSGVLNEDIADSLEEIRFCIEAERAGLHLWGASDEDIQIIEAYECLKDHVHQFVEKFDTKNMVFGLQNNKPVELVEGFFKVSFESANLEEALNNMKPGDSIQVLGLEGPDRKYRLGTVTNTIPDVNEGEVVVGLRTLTEL